MDWWEIDRRIMAACPGVTPVGIDQMTMPEISLASQVPRPMEEDKPKGSAQWPTEYMEWWRGLTLLQKLRVRWGIDPDGPQ